MDLINPGRIGNISGNFKTHGFDTALSFRIDIFEPLKKVMVAVRIFTPRSENDTEYGINRFNIQIDIDQLMKGKKTLFTTKVIVGLILNTFTPKLTLPTKEKSYLLSNLTIPGLLFRYDTKFLLKIAIHVKSVKNNKLMPMTNVAMEGELSSL